MEIVLGIVSSILATMLIAISSYVWKQRNELKLQIKALSLSGLDLPVINGSWLIEQSQNEITKKFRMDIKQYGRAISGKIKVDNSVLKVSGTYDGNSILAHYWGDKDKKLVSGSMTLLLSKDGKEIYGTGSSFGMDSTQISAFQVQARRC